MINRTLLSSVLILLPAMGVAESYPCLIEPSQLVELRPSVDGTIESVNVRRGDLFEKDQVLVVLESESQKVAVELASYRARMDGQITAARTRIDYAKTKLSRVADLEQKQFIAVQARDDITAEMRLAEAELDAALEGRELARIDHRRAQAELALRTLKTPFAGVVVDRMLDPGDLAESGSGRKAVLKIAQTDPLRIDVVLPAVLFGHIHREQVATVESTVGGGTYRALVDTVDGVIDAASGTFVARLKLPNPDLNVPIGSRCSAEFDGLSTAVLPK